MIFLTLSGPFGGLADHSYRLMPPAAHSIGFPFGKLLGSLPSRYMADTHGFGLSQDITLGSLHLARSTLQRRIGQKHDTIGAWSRIVYKLYNPARHSSATSAFRVQNSYSSLLTFQPFSNNPPSTSTCSSLSPSSSPLLLLLLQSPLPFPPPEPRLFVNNFTITHNKTSILTFLNRRLLLPPLSPPPLVPQFPLLWYALSRKKGSTKY